jgi:N-acyl-D-amino-acid deacylase
MEPGWWTEAGHGRIVYVGPLDPDTLEAGRVGEAVDAGGRVLAPGFIDAHAHGDPLDTPGFPNFLAQGVTTVLLGMDGGSPRASELAGVMARDRGPGPMVERGVAGRAWNPPHGVGHGVRALHPRGPGAAGGPRRAGHGRRCAGSLAGPRVRCRDVPPTPRSWPGSARWWPSATASSRATCETRTPTQVEASLEELLEQGERSGARVHASHLKVVLGSDPAQADRILARMDRARAEGVRVSADVYPYTASFTGIGILFPDWARPPADYAQVREARRGELATHLRDRVAAGTAPRPRSSAPAPTPAARWPKPPRPGASPTRTCSWSWAPPAPGRPTSSWTTP